MNKFKYEGKLPEYKKTTGWAFSDAVLLRDCPKCGCSAGYKCETPSGRKAWPPHDERIVVGPEHQAKIIRASDALT